MAKTLKDLQADAAAARTAADALQAEATRLVNEADLVRLNAQAKEDSARLAAEELAYELARLQIEGAKDQATKLDSGAKLAEETAAAARETAATLTDKARVARTAAQEAQARVKTLQDNVRPVGNFVRVEGGGFVEILPSGPRSPNVTAINGTLLDHVNDHASGDWVYRPRAIR